MSFEQSFLAAPAQQFALRHVEPPYAMMARMEADIEREGQPAVGRGAGGLLRALATITGARRALEVGTNIGYSGLWLLSGMPPEGHLDTIEFDASIAARAEANFREAGEAARVTIHRAPALEALPRMTAPYDLVFLDAAKAEYPQYLDAAARLLRPGGVLAADNAFWTGKAWDEARQDPDTRGVRELVRRAFEERATWAATTLVPVEDGVLVAVRA